MPYTKEQKRIIRDINAGLNVRVIAVAGSGKTSTILGTIGKHAPTLLLCYNNRLKSETIERVKMMMSDADEIGGYETFDVHTFHSFVYSNFDEPLATTDIGIVRVNTLLASIIAPTRKETIANARNVFPASSLKHLVGKQRYHRIIVDEAQDLTPEYFTLVRHLILITGASLTILGDPRQAIYQFNGATDKYLRNAHIHFGREFVDHKLSVSFRVPSFIATLVNHSCIPSDGPEDKLAVDIIPAKTKESAIKPMIYFTDPSEKMELIMNMLKKVPPEDVMILMYSTRRDEYRPSVRIANELIGAGIPVCFNGIGEDSEKGVLMISYHQSKGLERPIVICVDFGEYYFGINPDVRQDILPNLWYVAMTRASKFLIAFLDKPFPFITRGLSAIGFTPPDAIAVDIEGISKRDGSTINHSQEGDDGIVTQEEIEKYTSGGFDKLVRYTPTRVQMAIMNDYPESFTSVGMTPISTTLGDHSNTLIQEYTRACLLAGKEVGAREYAVEFRKAILGGLRGLSLSVGKVTVGGKSMAIENVMSMAYHIASHIVNTLDLVKIHGCRGNFGNVEVAGSVYTRSIEMVSEDEEVVIIIVTGMSIEGRLRVASFGERKILIIDILNGAYAKKGW